MEFLGTIGVILHGLWTGRHLTALLLAVVGVFILIDVKLWIDPVGLFWLALNAALFAGYIMLGHEVAKNGARGGIERLGTAMSIAFINLMPIGFAQACRHLLQQNWFWQGLASACARPASPTSAISSPCRACHARP